MKKLIYSAGDLILNRNVPCLTPTEIRFRESIQKLDNVLKNTIPSRLHKEEDFMYSYYHGEKMVPVYSAGDKNVFNRFDKIRNIIFLM